jgi:hypothetical protein
MQTETAARPFGPVSPTREHRRDLGRVSGKVRVCRPSFPVLQAVV